MNVDVRPVDVNVSETPSDSPINSLSSEDETIIDFEQAIKIGSVDNSIIFQNSSFSPIPSTTNLVVAIGVRKSKLPIMNTFLLGLVAGSFLSISGLYGLKLYAEMEGLFHGVKRLIFGFTSCIGLSLVNLFGAELITPNYAVLIPGLLARKINFFLYCKTVIVIFIGNFVSSMFCAVYFGKLMNSFQAQPEINLLISFCEARVWDSNWWVNTLRGIGGGIVIGSAMLLTNESRDTAGKILVVFAFVPMISLGFENAVANMFFLPLGQMYGANYSFGELFWYSIIPVSLGNFIGGFIIGGSLWYCHVFKGVRIPFIDPMSD